MYQFHRLFRPSAGHVSTCPRRGRRGSGKSPATRFSLLAMLIVVISSFGRAQITNPTPYPSTAEHTAPPWFVDVASKAGIAVRNVNGSVNSKRYIIEATGSCV